VSHAAAAGLSIVLTLLALCLAGFPVRALLRRLGVPPAISLMALGVLVGPRVADVLPEAWLEAGPTLSRSAFALLLLRAGFGLAPSTLKRLVGPALLFGIIPVAVELGAVFGLTAHFGLFSNWTMCLLAAFLVAAVSPAVVLPVMLDQKDQGRGATRLVPDRIIGQTVVNAFIAQTGFLIVLGATGPDATRSDVTSALLLLVPAIVGGVAVGLAAGWVVPMPGILRRDPNRSPRGHRRTAAFAALATALVVYFGCGALGLETVLATLALGCALRHRLAAVEPRIRIEFKRFWQIGEVVLFVNLGAAVDIGALADPALVAPLLAVIGVALLARVAVAAAMTRRTNLRAGEARYVAVAHVPKATIQAVFATLPLILFTQRGQMDLIADAETLVVLAVVAIVATAPIGAFVLERWGGRWLGPRDPQ